MTIERLEELYVLLYTNFYDDNIIHAELSLFNQHANTIEKLKNLIKEFINDMLTDVNIYEIADTIGIPPSELNFINK